MTYTYLVSGMTCNGCKASVEKSILTLEGVEQVFIELDTSRVDIKMINKISLSSFQKILPKKYLIVEQEQTNVLKTSLEEDNNIKIDLQQLYPLFLILGYITIATFLLNYLQWDWTNFTLDFMGLFYIVFSFFKLLDLKGFSESFKMYDPLAKAIPAYGFMYPFIEVGLGLLFLMRIKITLALIITVVILGITTIGVIQTLLSKKTIQCACLGTALKLPMTKATFIENSIMLIMAITMLFNIYK